jgi:hypothetical protein
LSFLNTSSDRHPNVIARSRGKIYAPKFKITDLNIDLKLSKYFER